MRAGLAHLRPLRQEFLHSGTVEEAGLCGLASVEGMLILRQVSRGERLARKIVSEYVRATLNPNAIAAVESLVEAIAARTASPSQVGELREFVVSLRTSPDREFGGWP